MCNDSVPLRVKCSCSVCANKKPSHIMCLSSLLPQAPQAKLRGCLEAKGIESGRREKGIDRLQRDRARGEHHGKESGEADEAGGAHVGSPRGQRESQSARERGRAAEAGAREGDSRRWWRGGDECWEENKDGTDRSIDRQGSPAAPDGGLRGGREETKGGGPLGLRAHIEAAS